MFSLLPRDEKYFERFNEMAQRIHEAARVLDPEGIHPPRSRVFEGAPSMKTFAAAFILGLVLTGSGRADLPDSKAFDAVLAARARNGGSDYRGATGQDRKRLAAYLANLGDARPSAMTPDEKKAFYVNAYNAMAIGSRFLAKSYRGSRLMSVRRACEGGPAS